MAKSLTDEEIEEINQWTAQSEAAQATFEEAAMLYLRSGKLQIITGVHAEFLEDHLILTALAQTGLNCPDEEIEEVVEALRADLLEQGIELRRPEIDNNGNLLPHRRSFDS